MTDPPDDFARLLKAAVDAQEDRDQAENRYHARMWDLRKANRWTIERALDEVDRARAARREAGDGE